MAGRKSTEATWLYAPSRTVIRFLCRVLFRLEVHGESNVPERGGFMLISNHASNLDPPMLGCMLKRPLHFLAKSELFKMPVLNWWARNVNAHPIRRGAVDRGAMREVNRILREGHGLVIFPEGTRTRDGSLQPAKAGVAMMAVQAGAPCVPAYVDGSYQAWPRDRLFPLPRKIRIFYGESFSLPPRPDGVSSKEHYHLCASEMWRRIDALREKAGRFRTQAKGESA